MRKQTEVTSREDAGQDLAALEAKLKAGIDQMFEHAHTGVYTGKQLMLANHTALLLTEMKTYFETIAGAVDMMLRHDMGILVVEVDEEGDDDHVN